MRDNGTVTDHETTVPEGVFVVSRTDPAGVIQFANQAFVDISGFSRAELVGQPHNIVRHPDMPPEAFADLWSTLGAGQCWVGLVKNRRKDGGFYWVRSSVSPMIEAGKVVG